MSKYDASDRTTICPNTGTGTYTLRSGSIYCPSETCASGGHFIKRVAFQRTSDAVAEMSGAPITSQAPRATKARVTKPAAATFDTGFDAFVRSDK
jgi:hypothetical protein